jgi:hypothetical protein
MLDVLPDVSAATLLASASPARTLTPLHSRIP